MSLTIGRMAGMAALVVTAAAGPVWAQDSGQDEIQRLAAQIRRQIVSLDNYGLFDWVTFTIERGESGYNVTLKGSASRPTLKDSAERVVKGIEVVRQVNNEIQVLPTSPMDEDVRLAVYVRIYGHPTLSRYNPNRGVPLPSFRRRAFLGISNDPPRGRHPIHIIVNNGNVTLEGTVDNEGDKSIANIQANQVSGVFKVTNNLDVLRP